MANRKKKKASGLKNYIGNKATRGEEANTIARIWVQMIRRMIYMTERRRGVRRMSNLICLLWGWECGSEVDRAFA